MIPEKLYIENFLCYSKSYIDFSEFNSAVIIGKIDNNELYSNGVGKTTIFKAIEYVLFNQSDINLEKIIRDDTNLCKIVFDFSIDNEKYRISRSRSKKGSSDISFFRRTSDPDDQFTYHDANINPTFNTKYWNELSGRRASDTEKDICKLIKINIKSFRSTIHFMQNDFTGLTTATPEKRKLILKEALNLVVYSKLEKIAKDKSSLLSKEIDKNTILLNNFGDSKSLAENFNLQVIDLKLKLNNIKININKDNLSLNNKNIRVNELTNILINLKSNFTDFKNQEEKLIQDKNRIDLWLKDKNTKKVTLNLQINSLELEIKKLKQNKEILSSMNFFEIDSLSLEISKFKDLMIENNLIIKNNTEKYNELIIPIPDNTICNHCRQPLSEQHKLICQKQINEDILNCKANINLAKQIIVSLKEKSVDCNNKIIELQQHKSNLAKIDTNISNIEIDLLSKNSLYEEYSNLCDKFINDLFIKNKEITEIKNKIEKSSIKEALLVEEEIILYKSEINLLSSNLDKLIKNQTMLQSQLAVAEFNYKETSADIEKEEKLKSLISKLENEHKTYPSVIQAFSSTGIPNLIIQNVLDNLQFEANDLLNQLKPGLQLLFVVEKTQANGTEADTLDIKYFVQSKERYYEQLSGAMKLAVTFSLKLGLSFLLQKMLGVNIKFLLLDEIDQSLDKGSIDAFADIIKVFQKEYKILIITHNDRIKDKFINKIVVEQDINGISNAKVINYV